MLMDLRDVSRQNMSKLRLKTKVWFFIAMITGGIGLIQPSIVWGPALRCFFGWISRNCSRCISTTLSTFTLVGLLGLPRFNFCMSSFQRCSGVTILDARWYRHNDAHPGRCSVQFHLRFEPVKSAVLVSLHNTNRPGYILLCNLIFASNCPYFPN